MSRSPEPADSSADLKMSIESGDGVLLAKVSGTLTLTRGLEVFQAICDTAVAKGFEKIFIDCAGLSGEISNRDRYEFGKQITGDQHKKWRSLKIALLGEEPVITGLGIVTAQNRGLDFELFSDRQRALAWLAHS